MENKLEYYSRLEDEIIRTYKKAEDEETRNAVRMLMKEHENKMFEQEPLDFYEVYQAYRKAVENGNKYLDFDGTYTPERIRDYVKILKENGIKHFTYSSTWTNALQDAWEFESAGAHLEKMTMTHWRGKDVPALKFTIE